MIEVGKTAGFCGGVSLCIKRLNEEILKEEKIYCLGEVVHNSDVVNDFKNKGVIFVDSIDLVPDNSVVAFRAHGVIKSVYEEANRRGIKIIDLTCPKVFNIREIVKPYLDDSFIILIAQKTHPEALSTISFCGDNSIIVEDESDMELVFDKIKDFSRVVVIAQTTFNEEKFLKYCDIIKENFFGEVIIKNTICNATHIRQEETREMAKKKDTMIIIGGKNSSNTRKLYDIASEYCCNTLICENINDLDLSLVNGSIGIMAGASTPKNVIDDIKFCLINLEKEVDK